MRKVLCTIVIMAAVLSAGRSIAAIYELSPTEDTWIYQYAANTNYGSDMTLGTAIQFMSPRGYTLLKFSLPVMSDEVIEIATLYLYQMNGGGYGEGPTALLLSSNNNWSESTLTWNNSSSGVMTPLTTNSDGHSHRGWSAWSFRWNYAYGNVVTLWLGENSSGDQSHNWYSKEDLVPDRRPSLLLVTTPTSFVDFSDVPPDHWAWLNIRVIFGAGYTTGYGGTTDFKPEYEVTREQMAVFILRALNDIPADGYCGTAAPFADVPADRWSCKYVKRLVELGITSGIGGGLFGPEGVVTREQMAAFITRALDEVPADGYCGTEDPFTDVPYGWWSCKYVKRLVELGVTKGIGEGLYGPGNPVTRAQMAVFLARAFLGM